MYHYAGNNPITYIDPDGNAWYSFFFKAVVWLGVNIFGEKSTKALYNDSLSGKLPDQIVSTPQNDMYSLSSGMSSEVNNIHIANSTNLMLDEIENSVNAGDGNGSSGARVFGKGKTKFGSDMQLAIGGCRLSWNKENQNGDLLSVDVTITDRFDFEPKPSKERSKSGEFLTKLGRLADMKEADITIKFTIFLKKDETGKYKYVEE